MKLNIFFLLLYHVHLTIHRVEDLCRIQYFKVDMIVFSEHCSHIFDSKLDKLSFETNLMMIYYSKMTLVKFELNIYEHRNN